MRADGGVDKGVPVDIFQDSGCLFVDRLDVGCKGQKKYRMTPNYLFKTAG